MIANAFISAHSRFTKFTRKLQPWILPDDLKPTREMTDSELAEDARSQLHFLSRGGINQSAVLFPHLMNIQYLRFCQYISVIPIKPYLMSHFAPLFLALLTGLIMTADIGPPLTNSSDVPLIARFIVGVCAGGFVGMCAGFATRSCLQFDLTYIQALLLKFDGNNNPVAALSIPLLRLGFLDNPKAIFTHKGGFESGDIVLRVPDNIDIGSLCYSNELLSEIYKWESVDCNIDIDTMDRVKKHKNEDKFQNLVIAYAFLKSGRRAIQKNSVYMNITRTFQK